MHLGLGRTRFDAFRFGSGPLTMELISTVHVAEQWRHGEVQKKKKKKKKKEKGKGKGKGRRPWAVVREPRSTVLQREQWRHGAEEEGEGEGGGGGGGGEGGGEWAAALDGGEGAALHCFST